MSCFCNAGCTRCVLELDRLRSREKVEERERVEREERREERENAPGMILMLHLVFTFLTGKS